jgi:hypothetical protein
MKIITVSRKIFNDDFGMLLTKKILLRSIMNKWLMTKN